jgi:hypothetical protein
MNWVTTLGRLLGYDNVTHVESMRASFGSAWANSSPTLVLFVCCCLCGLSFWFYLKWQIQGRRTTRLVLAMLRSTTFCIAFLILADPILELTLVNLPKPVLWILLDSSDSMSIVDELSTTERDLLENAVDLSGYRKRPSASQVPVAASNQAQHPEMIPRVDYARALLAKSHQNLVQRLSERYRLQFFAFAESQSIRVINSDDLANGELVAREWQTNGTTTAIGDAFEELARKHSTENLSAVLIFSDFDQNAGTGPLAVAKRLGIPCFTVGIGPLTAVDLSVDIQVPLTMKRAESSSINVTVRQRELDKPSVRVRLFVHQTGDVHDGESSRLPIGEKTVEITGEIAQIEFPFTPETTGRFAFRAQVDPVDGEVVVQNNFAEREVKVIDDFLRLMFVEYEPTWEWRFMKEVFHRDKLVGTRGFRTFIRSADPTVREMNELFLPSLTLPRSQFFENDVIFLGDVPTESLSTRFCEMTKEFVGHFGGGLVVIAGPRFGPGQLAETPLADLLPVAVNADSQRKDEKEFRLTLTSAALQYDFMRLGQTETENLKAWDNLAKLPWYQPVRRIETRGTRVLAEHPSDTCEDGQTHQPLIAIRQYGRGEVVYIGFNEMWRLRRLHGEEYYRQFWGQMIHRLGLSHAIGSHKRFVVRTDQTKYRPDDQVLVTVEAYDKEFHPLDERTLANRQLAAELIRPTQELSGSESIGIPQLKPGVFETRIPVMNSGDYRLRVSDPLSNEVNEIGFEVANISLERRNPIRNSTMQMNLADETGGKAYDLTTVDRFPDDFNPTRQQETNIQIASLWNNWLVFATVISLLTTEWLIRKSVHLG